MRPERQDTGGGGRGEGRNHSYRSGMNPRLLIKYGQVVIPGKGLHVPVCTGHQIPSYLGTLTGGCGWREGLISQHGSLEASGHLSRPSHGWSVRLRQDQVKQMLLLRILSLKVETQRCTKS